MSKTAVSILAVAGLAAAAQADIRFSEILGSTGGADAEFIEIANTGGAAVDISGYSVELWDSDTGSAFGTLDSSSPYVVPGGTILNPGQVYTFGNGTASTIVYASPNPTSYMGMPFVFDASIPENAIENSSYTAILTDAGSSMIDSWYFGDGGAGDEPNRAGATFTPNYVVPLDGTFLNSGAYIDFSDGTMYDLNFNTPGFADPTLNNGTAAGGTPGILVPAPGAAALLGMGGLLIARRRR